MNNTTDLFIVDNNDIDRKAHTYLRACCEHSSAIDIGTGYFEAGALLAVEEEWQQVDPICILMGDEVSL